MLNRTQINRIMLFYRAWNHTCQLTGKSRNKSETGKRFGFTEYYLRKELCLIGIETMKTRMNKKGKKIYVFLSKINKLVK